MTTSSSSTRRPQGVPGLPPAGPLAFGAATASYQIEGSLDADGRGPSIWDTFAARPGAIRDGSDGSTACDSYRRHEEDADLVAGIGPGSWYRFSLAWSRILPTGTGAVESRGLDHYDRVVDTLLARGVTPSVTLYHWDLPQALEDRGGWLDRGTAEAFADYAAIAWERLGDRVVSWATLNEPWCSAYLGYAAGVHAPGRREGEAGHRAAHHLMLAHGLGAARLRELAGDRPLSVGLALNLAPVWPERPEAAGLAHDIDAIRNRVWLDPLADGAYDADLLRVAPVLADPDLVREGDLDLVRGSVDWVGVNYYTPIRPDLPVEGRPPHPEGGAYPGVAAFDLIVREPVTDIGWEVDANGLEEILRSTHERTGVPVVVTENGAACADTERAEDGHVLDQDRVDYLRDHIEAVDRARAAGADVRLYLVWTLLDNYEWAEGYTKTFGIVHIDPADQTRTPKESYRWLVDHVAARAGVR